MCPTPGLQAALVHAAEAEDLHLSIEMLSPAPSVTLLIPMGLTMAAASPDTAGPFSHHASESFRMQRQADTSQRRGLICRASSRSPCCIVASVRRKTSGTDRPPRLQRELSEFPNSHNHPTGSWDHLPRGLLGVAHRVLAGCQRKSLNRSSGLYMADPLRWARLRSTALSRVNAKPPLSPVFLSVFLPVVVMMPTRVLPPALVLPGSR